MYRNKYLILPDNAAKVIPEFNRLSCLGLSIYTHNSLDISFSRNEIVEVVLIGYAINPLTPEKSNEELVEELCFTCLNSDDFFRETQAFTGRYVLLFKSESSFVVTGDACHLREIYFGSVEDVFTITSSPKLCLDYFNSEPKINSEKLSFINSKRYLESESAWYGNESIDDRLFKLLPNQYLDLLNSRVFRLPFSVVPGLDNDEESMVQYVSSMLIGTFSALARRHKMIQPLTAGWDTRLLLAASKKFRDEIKFYIFNPNPSNVVADVEIAQRLSQKLGLNFDIIDPSSLDNKFLRHYEGEHIFPRILPKTSHIQHHFYQKYDLNFINVNGNSTEIVRCFYGASSKEVSFDVLLTLSGCLGGGTYVETQLREWYSDAVVYAREYEIPILDLFYWEQRMGHWGSLFPSEQDIAIEEISPFNNRNLLFSTFRIKAEKRCSPNYSFFKKVIKALWEDVLCEPVNPDKAYLSKVIDRSSMAKYMKLKIKSKTLAWR